MRTQILKGAGLAVVLGMLTVSAPAPVAAADIRANVPFSFTVKGKVLPAGAYNVTNNNAEQNISVSSGASWLRPITIVSPRLMRVGVKFDW